MTTMEQSVHLVERAAQRLRVRGQVAAERLDGPGLAGAALPGIAADQAAEIITTRQLERAGLVSQMTERNRVWEEFRIAQSQLTLNTPVAGLGTNVGANLCMVTSALAGEGKTFCAINLAASIARYSTGRCCWWTSIPS